MFFKVGNSNVDIANKIYVDASGNVYVVGSIIQSAFFEKTGGITGFQNGGSGKGFVVKYDNTLAIQWSIGLGPAALNGTEVKDIAVDASGNVYITGQLKSNAAVNFNPGASGPGATAGPYTAINLTPNGSVSPDAFVAVYNSGGVCQWAINIGGSDTDVGFGIDYDNAGNTYVTGAFREQNVNFNPAGTFNLSEYGGGSVTSGDIFVAKYSNTGTFINAFNIGNALYEQTNGIAVDKATGDFAITGYFAKDANPLDFDPGAGTANATAVGSTGSDMFVAKYNSSLVYQWHKTVGSAGNEKGNHIRLTGTNVFVTGSFEGTATDFGNSNALTTAGGLDVFMAGYTFATGNCLFASGLGGTSNEEGNGIAYASNKLYVTGYFNGSGDFDPAAATTTTLTSTGSDDIFFGKYSYSTCVPASITTQPSSLTKCVGASATFTVVATGATTYQWQKDGVNASGTSTNATYTIASVALADAGNYTVIVNNACSTAVTSTPAAVLTVNTPASITTQPSSLTQCTGTTATFTVVASGTAPLTYQWQKVE